MIVRIATTECEFRNTHPGMKKMFAWIDESLIALKMKPSHLVVDGVEVHEAPLDYVKKKLPSIGEIEVIPLKKKPAGQKRKIKTSSTTMTDTIVVKMANLNFEVKKTPAGLDEMLSRMDQTMVDFHIYFSHLIIDGNVVTDDPKSFLEKHLNSIQDIEVCFIDAGQYLIKIIDILQTFLDKALPAIEEIAQEFYMKPSADTWERFNIALDGMKNLIGFVQNVMNDSALASKLHEISSLGASFYNDLAKLLDAAERGDNTLIADILIYEILPFFENLLQAICNISERHCNAVN